MLHVLHEQVFRYSLDALNRAAKNGFLDVLDFLLKEGADCTTVRQNTKTRVCHDGPGVVLSVVSSQRGAYSKTCQVTIYMIRSLAIVEHIPAFVFFMAHRDVLYTRYCLEYICQPIGWYATTTYLR